MTHPAFKDHFSELAAGYAEFRPGYPPDLFRWLATLIPPRLAWDCATGSGQAARELARHFERVIATDASAGQITYAAPHPRVEYRVAPAEDSGLPAASVDLVTVAQALHWFDVERFYAEARRVLRPEGVLAVWGYGDLVLDDPELNAPFEHFHREWVEPWWPPERATLLDGYRSLHFPFDPIAAPPLEMRAGMTLPQLLGYVGTWSSVRAYRAARGEDPLPALRDALRELWGPADLSRPVRWPLFVRVGRAGG